MYIFNFNFVEQRSVDGNKSKTNEIIMALPMLSKTAYNID